MTERRFPPPWTVEKPRAGSWCAMQISSQWPMSISRENPSDGRLAKVLTEDEARRTCELHGNEVGIACISTLAYSGSDM
jgi:hypothetical protein